MINQLISKYVSGSYHRRFHLPQHQVYSGAVIRRYVNGILSRTGILRATAIVCLGSVVGKRFEKRDAGKV